MDRPFTAFGLTALVLAASAQPVSARAAFSCGGFAQLGGAQLLCSHTDPAAPTQICTFSWTLVATSGAPSVVQGSFGLTPGLTNLTAYQGTGYTYALATPVVLCQGRKTGG